MSDIEEEDRNTDSENSLNDSENEDSDGSVNNDMLNDSDNESDLDDEENISLERDKQPPDSQTNKSSNFLENIGNDDDDNSEDDNEEEESDEDSDDEEDDNSYYYKTEKKYDELEEAHPECKHHNFDEIYALSKVVRNFEGTIIDELHKTLPILSKYEKTRIIGQRMSQLENGHMSFVKLDTQNNKIIAEEELKQKKIPFIIRRPLPNGSSEYWKVSDLEIL